jgi:hypothetical protein
LTSSRKLGRHLPIMLSRVKSLSTS